MPARELDNYLRACRKRSGLTQRQLSFLLGGNNAAHVFRYERGRRPSHDASIKCDALFGHWQPETFPGAKRKSLVDLRERIEVLREGVLSPTAREFLDDRAPTINP